MERWISSFLIGAILSLFLPQVPVLFCLIISVICFILSFWFKPWLYLGIILLGCFWINLAELNYQASAPQTLFDSFTHQKTYIVKGEVLTIPKQNKEKQYFNFLIFHWDDIQLKKPIKVRLTWQQSTSQILQGQIWQLSVRLKPAHGFNNTGSFSYKTWLRKQGVVASGYIVAKAASNSGEGSSNILLKHTPSYRQAWYLAYQAQFGDSPLSSLIEALSFGERGNFTPEIQAVLQATATQHLVAISGLHLGLVATGSFFFFSCLVRLLPFSSLGLTHKLWWTQINTKYFCIVGSLLISVLYAYIAGLALPTIRALTMLSLYWVIRLSCTKTSWLTTLCITLFLVILLWPFSLISISFWLSFGAVILIILISWRWLQSLPEQQSWRNKVFNFIKLQFLLTVLMLPVSALLNHEFSYLAIFANLVAVPFMALTVIPLCLLGVICLITYIPLDSYCFQLAHYCLMLLWRYLSFISQQEWSFISIDLTSWGWGVLVLTLLFICALGNLPRRVLLFSTLFSFLALASTSYKSKKLLWSITVLDVGQGLAVVIEKDKHAILYDTGASYPSGFQLVEAVVEPYLSSQGISRLDEVIISHNDNDHAGGINYLKKQSLAVSYRANDPLLNAKLACQQGSKVNWQGLSFNFLWPERKTQGQDNDDSCVVRITDGKHSVLLTGDISYKIEQRLVEQNMPLDADILIAPHHGSKTSSSHEFISQVSPLYTVFSAGYLNRWKMPNKSVLARYQQQDLSWFTTADKGMIRFDIYKNHIQVQTFLDDIWPLWFVK